MKYINKLDEMMPSILECIERSIGDEQFRERVWGSLLINRRKPHTHRAFFLKGEGEFRVCLHRFDPCGPEDAFKHPHPWPAAFVVVGGSYRHWIGRSNNRFDPPVPVLDSVMKPGSKYEITHPLTWHSVQPLETAYTIMVNGMNFPEMHVETRTTKGKDLEKLTDEQLLSLLTEVYSRRDILN